MLRAVENLESRRLLTTTPIWNEPTIVQTNINEVIHVEGADISGDGVDDAIAAGPNVLYYVSNRDDTFAEPQELTSDGVGYGMTLARDVDGDNDLDVIASSSAKGIIVIKNNGDGTFTEEESVTALPGIIRLSTADMDGDGDTDVVSGSYSDKRLAWHENRGDGTFEPAAIINEGVEGLYSVKTADLNGDGRPEIVTAEFGEDNAVALYTNTEAGFERTTISNDLNAPLAVEVADIDGDGDEDVVAAAYYGDDIVWYENDGEANFAKNENGEVSDEVIGTFRVQAADWDNDSDLDLISVSTKDDKVAFHENLGGGKFAKQAVLFDNWSSPTAGSPADIDGDADQDLLVASVADDTLLLVRNDTVRPDTRFTTQSIISDQASFVFVVDAIDLNGDGSRDLLAALPGDARQVTWAANDGNGEFGELQVIDTQAGSVLFAGAADLDGDGDNDVYTTSAFDANEISWYENLGGGTFGEQQVIESELGEPSWLGAGDADGDGDLDLFGATRDDRRYFWYENRLNEEISEFVLAQVILDGEGEGANKLIPIDMDNDGDLDALAASARPSEPRPITWYENDGTGNFTNPTVIAESTVSRYYARPADIDGDGDIDVVATSFVAPLVWFENLGDGTFSPEQVIATNTEGAYGLDVADMDGDGDVDVVTGSYTNEIAWYENNGDGTFSGQQVISRTQSGVFSVITADIDGDGDEDVVAGSYYDDTVAWYENNPDSADTQELLPAINRYVTTEHLDLAFNFIEGEWQATVDVDFETGDEFLPSDEVVIFALPASQTTRPEDAIWDFMGVPAGEQVWVLPQSRNPEIAWPGFAVDRTDNGTFARYFERDPRIDSERDWVKIELVDVRGPEGAHFGTYSTIDRQAEVSLGVWMSTADGIAPDDAFWQREGGHSHANFFFTQPGVYEVDLKASGFIDVNANRVFDPGLDVYSESDVSTFYFAVETPNTAPTITAPTAIDAAAGQAVAVDSIQISDAEPSSGDYEVSLQATGGTLTIEPADIQLLSGDGTEDAQVTLLGALGGLNAALASLQFNAGAESIDSASIQIDVSDGGFFHPDIDGDGTRDNAASASASILVNIIVPPASGREVGDLDDSGEVNFDDFLILSATFGMEVEPSTGGDVDGNGEVNFTDFLVLSKNFGKRVDELFAQE